MNKEVCESFQSVWDVFPDTLNKGEYEFKKNNFLTSYCGDNECKANLEKMNAVFYHLVNKFFGSSGVFNNNVKNNINAVEYILIWLSHMLNLKDNTGNILTNFYKVYIYNQEKYKNPINGVDGCKNYNDLIYTKKELMEIINEKLSKFYAPFKSLCNMYNAFNETKPNCDKCLNYADEFVKKYNELNGDSSITNDSSRNKLLCTLSNDYDNFKKKYDDIQSCNSSPLPTIKKSEKCVQSFEQSSKQSSHLILEQVSGDISSSSIGNKLFTVLSIFGAIAFFLGISYKCEKFDLLRAYLPDDLSATTKLDLNDNSKIKKYCPENGSGDNTCNTNLDEITAGFLWLLGECYSTLTTNGYDQNNTNAFFIHMISWFSYKLNQNEGKKFNTINDFFNEYVKSSDNYKSFITDAYRIGNLKEFMDKRNDLLNINIEDLSKFYDASKLLCSMYINAEKHTKDSTVPNEAKNFVIKYKDLNESYNIEDTARRKILPFLLTDYNNLINKCKSFTSLPDITTEFSAQMSGVTSSSSSTANKLFTVLSIFGAIAFFLGISYKYSLFGFRKRAQKQYLREKIKKIKKKMNH
ncbi:hypothetical protein YYC_00052 [Plasmodium yoelii 17X]|uniref:Uncharacterized protein n=1 Tax=Plasmodium yoelii 17X TaxID=1323249 RepID=V7PZ90_PLAYE|nr:hypothetical protein YYC_00052 [Plasmodium yoelii 17X]